jgi:hypothetical protein
MLVVQSLKRQTAFGEQLALEENANWSRRIRQAHATLKMIVSPSFQGSVLLGGL